MTALQENSPAERPIGVFDSGVGGLTVFREIMRQMPDEKIVYFGDTARVPYGSKSKETILRFSRQIVRFLLSKNVKAIVVACNTASANALPELEKECPVPIIGVIVPGARTACRVTEGGRIGVIGTTATINSGIYAEVIRDIRPDAQVIGRACPLFVPLVEEGLWEDPVTDEIARRYIGELTQEGIDTLILGCTHYPLIKEAIGRTAGDKVHLVNPAKETARELHEMLADKGLENRIRPALGSGEEQYSFYVSDMAEKFRRFANTIIPYGVLSARAVTLDE